MIKTIKRLANNFGINLDDKNGLLKDSGKIYFLQVGGLFIGFVLQVFLARVLGVEQFGIYIYVLTWVNLIAFFSKLGFDTSPRRFLSVYASEAKWDTFKAFVSFSSITTFLISIVASITMAGVTYYFIDDIKHLKQTFYIGSLLLLFITQLGIYSSYLESINQIKKSLLNQSYLKPILILTAGVTALFLIKNPTSATFMSINVGVSFLTFIVMLKWIFSETSKGIHLLDSYKQNWKIWLKVSVPLLLVSGTHLLLNETDAIILGILKGTDNVGIYKAATKFSYLAMFGFSAVELILAPMIAKLYAEGNLKQLQLMLRKGVKAMIFLTLPILILVALSGKFLLGLYGSGFSSGYFSLLILLGSQAINLFTGAVSYLMTMTNYQREALLILLVSLVLNGILNLLLIPEYGMEGAAIATGITTILWNVVMVWFAKVRMGLDPSIIGMFFGVLNKD